MKTYEKYKGAMVSENGIFRYDENSNIEYANIGYISESSLSRLWKQVQNNDFCVITAFRGEYNRKQNIKRNQELLKTLNKEKMGPYSLIGHWQEAPDGVEWKDANPEDLTDVQEDSFLFVRKTEMDVESFKEFVTELVKTYNQNAGVISIDGTIYLIFKDGSTEKIGNSMKMNTIGDAYSIMKKKPKIPFVFEGLRIPNAPVLGRAVFNKIGLKYPKWN